MSDGNGVLALVVDNGSGMSKTGFAGGNDSPRTVFPPATERAKHHRGCANLGVEGVMTPCSFPCRYANAKLIIRSTASSA